MKPKQQFLEESVEISKEYLGLNLNQEKKFSDAMSRIWDIAEIALSLLEPADKRYSRLQFELDSLLHIFSEIGIRTPRDIQLSIRANICDVEDRDVKSILQMFAQDSWQIVLKV